MSSPQRADRVVLAAPVAAVQKTATMVNLSPLLHRTEVLHRAVACQTSKPCALRNRHSSCLCFARFTLCHDPKNWGGLKAPRFKTGHVQSRLQVTLPVARCMHNCGGSSSNITHGQNSDQINGQFKTQVALYAVQTLGRPSAKSAEIQAKECAAYNISKVTTEL